MARPQERAVGERLSGRDRLVAQLEAFGRTEKEIAQELGMAPRRVARVRKHAEYAKWLEVACEGMRERFADRLADQLRVLGPQATEALGHVLTTRGQDKPEDRRVRVQAANVVLQHHPDLRHAAKGAEDGGGPSVRLILEADAVLVLRNAVREAGEGSEERVSVTPGLRQLGAAVEEAGG